MDFDRYQLDVDTLRKVALQGNKKANEPIGEEKQKALRELGERLTWTCQIYNRVWKPIEDEEVNQTDLSQIERVGRKQLLRYIPKNAKEEAALSLLAFLEEERNTVGPKGTSKLPFVRRTLIPLLLWGKHYRAAVEVLSAAENASGKLEGSERYKRWRMLALTSISGGVPQRAVRIVENYIKGKFEEKNSFANGTGIEHKIDTDFGGQSTLSLLLAARARLENHRQNARQNVFDGGRTVAIAAGWAEKAIVKCQENPSDSYLGETAAITYASCLLEAITRAHRGVPSCSPPREVRDGAFTEAETYLIQYTDVRRRGTCNPIVIYLLAIVKAYRNQAIEGISLLERLKSSNSLVYVYSRALMAILLAITNRAAKGSDILESVLQEVIENTPEECFLLRLKLRFCTQYKMEVDEDQIISAIESLNTKGKHRLSSILASELSQYYAAEGNIQKAKQTAEKATQLDETCALAYHSRGIVLEASGDDHGALGSYEKAMALVPQYGPSALSSAKIWMRKQDSYMWHARTLCKDALLWNPNNSEALLALGKIEELMGDMEASKAHNVLGLSLVDLSPCLPYCEFPLIVWEDDLEADCFSY